MNHYQKQIQQFAGCSQEQAVDLEEIIREKYPTLDHLSYSELRREALEAVEVLKAINHLKAYAKSLGVEKWHSLNEEQIEIALSLQI